MNKVKQNFYVISTLLSVAALILNICIYKFIKKGIGEDVSTFSIFQLIQVLSIPLLSFILSLILVWVFCGYWMIKRLIKKGLTEDQLKEIFLDEKIPVISSVLDKIIIKAVSSKRSSK